MLHFFLERRELICLNSLIPPHPKLGEDGNINISFEVRGGWGGGLCSANMERKAGGTNSPSWKYTQCESPILM